LRLSLWSAEFGLAASTRHSTYDLVGPRVPYGWRYYTIWQNADSGTFPGDQDRFNGAYSQLQAIANG
jgi:hypothetical protein